MDKDPLKWFSAIYAQVEEMPFGARVQFVIGLAAYTLTRHGMTPDNAVSLLLHTMRVASAHFHCSRLTVGPEGAKTRHDESAKVPREVEQAALARLEAVRDEIQRIVGASWRIALSLSFAPHENGPVDHG